MNAALLIIDVQVGGFDGERITPIKNSSRLLSNIKKLLSYSREKNINVIYIKDCGQVGGAFEKNSRHWPLHNLIEPLSNETIIEKYHGDAFEQSRLSIELQNEKIDNLIITGIHSDKCITSTVLSGINHGYRLVVASDAHDSNDVNSEKIVDNQNSLFTKIGCIVMTTDNLIGSGLFLSHNS